MQLSFVETDYTVDEGEGVQRVCVELTGVLETSISVTVHTEPNTALGMHSELYVILHCLMLYLIFNTPTNLHTHAHGCTCNNFFHITIEVLLTHVFFNIDVI